MLHYLKYNENDANFEVLCKMLNEDCGVYISYLRYIMPGWVKTICSVFF